MTYKFERMRELGWAVAVAVATFVVSVLVDFDAATIEDWQVWATSLISGAIRAAAGAALAFLRPG